MVGISEKKEKLKTLEDYNQPNRKWSIGVEEPQIGIWRRAEGTSETDVCIYFDRVKKDGCLYLLFSGKEIIAEINSNTIPEYLDNILNSIMVILEDQA